VNITEQSQGGNLDSRSPRNSQRTYFDDDSDDDSDDNDSDYDNEQQPIATDTTGRSASSRSSILKDRIKSTSASMAAASEAHMSEYEHWKVRDISQGGGCESSCSNGKETVEAFGDVVTELFDLINEVAFPEVMDLAKEGEDKEIQSPLNTGSYREDEDSVFVRSVAYDKSKKAREFLGFIGAVKSGNKHIISISTPAAPSALLVPDGIPLNLLSESSSIVETDTTEEEEKVDEAEKQDDRDNLNNNDNDCVAEEDDSIKHAVRSRYPPKKIPDRYSSLDGSFSSDESSNGDTDEEDDDWNGSRSKNSTDQDYENYIMDVRNKEEKRGKISPLTSDKVPSNPILPFSLKGAAHIKSAIAKSFKRAKPKYSKPSSVGGAEKPELLTIVESSDEERHSSEEENVLDKAVCSSEENELLTQVEIIPEPEVREEGEIGGKSGLSKEAETKNRQTEMAPKTDGTIEEEYSTSTVTGSSYSSSDDDDRTYTSYTGSDDDSFLDVDDVSYTSHTRYSAGIEENSITYSIGAKDGVLDESISHPSNSMKSNESSYNGSLLRRTLSDGSSEDDSDEKVVERKTSVAESLLAEDEEEGSKKNEEGSSKYVAIEPPQFCSVYDNLYPTDSLFSFATQDETLFDFSNSNIELETPPAILNDGTMEEEPSVLTEKSNVEEENDHIEPTECNIKQQNDEELKFAEREVKLKEEEVQEDARRQKAEAEVTIDAENDGEGNSNYNEQRYVDVEERDGVEENKTVEEKLQDETEGGEVTSRISDSFVSAVYGDAEQPPGALKRSRILPPRRHYRGRKKSLVNLSCEATSEDRGGKTTSTDEGSSSNRSRNSAESTETVDTINDKTAADANTPTSGTNPTSRRARRTLLRLKIYNQHRKNILKLKQKAE